MKNLYFFLFSIIFLGIEVSAQMYCEDGPASLNGEFISRFNFDNQFNNTSGAGSYTNYTGNANLTAVVSPGVGYDLEVDVQTDGFTHHCWLYFDWDDNGSWETAVDLGQGNGAPFNFTITYTIPAATPSGDYRMRVYTRYNSDPDADGCGIAGNGEVEDYAITVCNGVDMTINATTVNQNSNVTSIGSTQQQILGININTKDCDDAIVLKSMNFDAASSDDIIGDASNGRLYFTGANGTFSTATPVGNVATPASSFSISSIDANLPTLREGDNWFWLTYNIKNGATIDNVVDAALLDFIYDDATGLNNTFTVTSGNPMGARKIINSYCNPAPANATGAAIDDVRINGFASGNAGHNGSRTNELGNGSQFDLCANSDYLLEVDWSSDEAVIGAAYPLYVTAYFDWNRDGDFDDTDEHYYLGTDISGTFTTTTNGTFSSNIRVPSHALSGFTAMRIVIISTYTQDACVGDDILGETEDYGFTTHTLGDVSLTGSNVVCEADSVLLTVNNANPGYDFQNSLDGVTWNNVPNTTDAATLYSDFIDETMYYRLASTNAACPNSEIFSNEVNLPFVGIKSVYTIKDQICLGDNSEIGSDYDFPITSFTSAPAADVAADEVVQFDLVVAGIDYNYVNNALLDSICLDITTDNATNTNVFLQAPDGVTRILLNAGNGGNGTYRYCFTPNATTDIVGATGDLNGAYIPEQSLDFMNGQDPNGTWSLLVHQGAGTATVNEFSMSFGVNPGVDWSPATNLADATADTTVATPTETITYYANMPNKYCVAQDSVSITVLSGDPIEVAINLLSPTGNICVGDAVTFEATLSEPIQNPPLQWKISGTDVAGETSNTFTTTALVPGDFVHVEFDVTTVCGNFNDRDTIYPTINPVLNPTLDITTNDVFPVCDGATVTFTADSSNWGPGANVEWFVDGASVQMGGQMYTTNTLANGNVVSVTIDNMYECLSVNNLTDDSTFTSSAPINPDIVLNTSIENGLVCLGNTIEFNADTTANNSGGYGTLSWFFDGVPVANLPASFATDTFSSGMHSVRVDYNVVSGCTSSNLVSDQVNFQVGSEIVPAVEVTSSNFNVCAGDSIFFEVSNVINGGTTPTFQWFVNGERVDGALGMEYATNDFNSGDEVSVRMRTSLECAAFGSAFSSPIVVRLQQVVPTAINIFSQQALDPICENQAVQITVELVEGGGNFPIYEWYLNENLVQRNEYDFLNLSSIENGDRVYAKLVTEVICARPDYPVSDTLDFSVTPLPEVDFTFNKTPEGMRFTPNSTSFEAYFWTFEGGGTSNQTFPNYPFNGTGIYEVCLTVTDENGCQNTTCQDVNYVEPVGIEDQNSLSSIEVFPNPFTNTITIKGVSDPTNTTFDLVGITGQTLVLPNQKTTDGFRIETSSLAPGVYQMRITNGASLQVLKLVKQ